MKQFLLIFAAAAASLYAQPQVTMSTGSPAYPGASVNLSVNISGTATASGIVAVAFGLPPGTNSPVVGAATTSAAKQIFSNASTVLLLPSLASPNVTPFTDGVLMLLTYSIPPTATPGTAISLPLSVLAVDATASPVTISAPAYSLQVGLNPSCTPRIQAAITQELATPTIATLQLIVADINTALAGGACQ